MQNDGLRGGAWMAPLLVGAVLGPALQLQQAALWLPGTYLAVGLVALAGGGLLFLPEPARATRRRGLSRVVRWCWLMAAAAALAFASCGVRSLLFASGGLAPALEGRDIQVAGRVAAMPQANELGIRFQLRVESAEAGGVPVSVPPRILLSWYGGVTNAAPGVMELQQRASPDLRAGDRWQLTVRLKAPHGNSNPHGFDYELWLWEQGLQATGYVRAGRNDPPPRRLASGWRHPVERARQATRDAIYAHGLDRQGAGLLAALVVGDQNAIDRADWDVFRATGTAHLMSISGLHITMFAWAAALGVGALWRRSTRLCLRWPAQHAALVGGLLLATAYALFSGWGVPAQRTLLMLGTVTLLRVSGREWPWPQVWLLACAVVVCVDPWALLQPGFWLSFIAVGVLFASAGSASEAAGPALPAEAVRPGAVASRALATVSAAVAAARGLLREQATVTLALAPLTLLLFGQVSLVGLAANLIAIPWVTFLVTPLAMAGVALPAMWDLAALAARALGWTLQHLAQLPFATWSSAAAPLWTGAAGVIGGLLLVLRLPLPLRLLGIPLLLPVLWWPAQRPDEGQFELLAADVGQGNAVVVRTARHTLVYDAGPRYSSESDAGHRVLLPLLRALGSRVDMLVVSHRDSDHSGGARAVLSAHPQAGLLSSIEPGHELQQLRPAGRCVAGQRWRWDGVDFAVLHPAALDYESPARPNALSCVLRITNGTQAALLAGDIEQAQEARLVQEHSSLDSDLLLVPHHGSKTSSSTTFIDAVQPRWALVQAGYRNRFGHPAEIVTQRYVERGIALVDSSRCGAARWSSADPENLVCQRQLAPRYWHHRLPPESLRPAGPP